MSWLKLDDQFSNHPKVVEAGPLAGWLYICGLGYAGQYLTDGFIPEKQVKRLADVEDPEELASKLCAVKLWERVEGGFRIHDYLQYNPSAAMAKQRRDEISKARSEAGSKGAKARWETDSNADSKLP